MQNYIIYVEGYEVGKEALTPEQVRKYNANGIVCLKA